MYNANTPSNEDLPSTGQLLKSTILAAFAAGILLVTVVMPAEYAIDPTGIGQALGLMHMGEIKTSLAEEAAADAEAHSHGSDAEAHNHGSDVEPVEIETPAPEPETHSHGHGHHHGDGNYHHH